MKLNEAIDILRKDGYIVNRYNKGYLVSRPKESMWHGKSFGTDYLTARSLIKFAQIWRCNQPLTGKCKEKRHYKNRAKTKENIAKEKFENFHKNTLAADSNPWDFD
jgi:hypothetical protein